MTAQEIFFTCQTQGVKLELTEEGKLEAIGQLNDDLRTVIKENLFDLKSYLLKQNHIPRLSFKFERLIQAALANQLKVAKPGVSDINRYVLGCACSYLIGDKEQGERDLGEVLVLKELELN